jgi:hypothetical protein
MTLFVATPPSRYGHNGGTNRILKLSGTKDPAGMVTAAVSEWINALASSP